ncbi:cobalt-precorrin-5B (C(1))-methyltransferase CbiD [Chlorobium sp. N1]|uniref:cobalt-precorrin-5B (C(1))-methyltransferase CbiD n=1 Tax=Chlorobium sp. N1 TaxID=2491138 RepID=UPI001F61C396|nr:cobalt-precorrin-5B (C(1))-methyltransferase CbiD [Chlorobium sp. N1]
MAGMTLVFGGTTEGRRTAFLLDRLGMPFLYSTKERVEPFQTVHGEFRHGPLDRSALEALLDERPFGLVIDAAHPFAAALHQTVYDACSARGVRLIRYDRSRDPSADQLLEFPGIHRAADFGEALATLERLRPSVLLALTGVQSIGPLRRWWSGRKTLFRILPRTSSIEAARSEGIPEKWLIKEMPEAGPDAFVELIDRFGVDCLLTKESGASGYLGDKLEAASRRDIPAIVITRPPVPPWRTRLFSDSELEKVLQGELQSHPMPAALRKGYTTGATAAAATRAAMQALLKGRFPEEVLLTLPSGKKARFVIEEPIFSGGSARCSVRKDGGDDPDVTHGLLISSEVSLIGGEPESVEFLQGEGVGRVTLPGLEIPPGEPAINPVPRRMIRDEVVAALRMSDVESAVSVKISVAGGSEAAKKTMNPRLGILDGISIIGTTGEVVPYSMDAWIASIRQAIHVTGANGCREIALTSGLRSERMLRDRYSGLDARGCVHYGNFIARALKAVGEQGGFERVYVAVMLAKATKLAAGEPDLSSRTVPLRPERLGDLARRAGYGEEVCLRLNDLKLVRSMTEILPFRAGEPFYERLAEACVESCRRWLPEIPLTFVLLDIEGHMLVMNR